MHPRDERGPPGALAAARLVRGPDALFPAVRARGPTPGLARRADGGDPRPVRRHRARTVPQGNVPPWSRAGQHTLLRPHMRLTTSLIC